MAGVVALVFVAGCGRVGYDQALTASDAGTPDALVDAHGDAGVAGDSGTDAGVSLPDAEAIDSPVEGDAGFCAEDPCRLFLEQCGCPAGQMCTRPFPMSSTRACRAIGPQELGGACGFSTECTTGTGCIRANGQGICALWCGSTADCPPDAHCGRFVSGDPEVGACSWPCNPVTNEGCPSTHQCVLGGAEELGTSAIFGTTFCAGPGTTPRGATCTSPFECEPGSTCDGVCRQACALGAGSCPGGTTCQDWSPVVRVGDTSYGVCR